MRHGEEGHLGVQGAEEGEPAAARFRRAQAAGAPGTRAPMNRWPDEVARTGGDDRREKESLPKPFRKQYRCAQLVKNSALQLVSDGLADGAYITWLPPSRRPSATTTRLPHPPPRRLVARAGALDPTSSRVQISFVTNVAADRG